MTTSIVVAGALAGKPGNGGEAWVHLSWVRGLIQLGFDVWFVEELATALESTATATTTTTTTGSPDPRGTWFHTIVERFGLADRAILVEPGQVCVDPRLHDVLGDAALLVNISGNLRRDDLLGRCRRAAYIDLDPGFTQIWAANGVGDLGLDRHHVHFSVGENIGSPSCPLPTAGLRWLPCRQPVLLDDWPVMPCDPGAPFTTVATWRCAFGPLSWDGVDYRLKLHEFRRIVELAGGAVPLELALDMHPADQADRDRLLECGWRLRRADAVAGTPDNFRRYVQSSAGELSATQGVYAHGRTGWFSDRTVRYLASGRPAIVQDTCLAADIEVGEGLLVFRDLHGARAALDAVAADPARHGAAARALAESTFEASLVLERFLELAGV